MLSVYPADKINVNQHARARQFLSAEQVLLTTLVVKLAVMAALATMLVRYRRFRHILIFERRDWPDRLVFALGLGIPLVGRRRRAAAARTTTPPT